MIDSHPDSDPQEPLPAPAQHDPLPPVGVPQSTAVPLVPTDVEPVLASTAMEPVGFTDPSLQSQRHLSLYKLTWLMTILGLMLVSMCIGPYFIEQFEYAKARGRQRAEVEMAKTALPATSLMELSKAYQLVSMRVGPSVVHINVLGVDTPEEEEPALRRFRDAQGQGSGVIIDTDGYIATNRHVVDGAKKIEIVLSDGRRVPATIVGLDNLTDLAVLKVDASGLIAAEWGNSDDLEVGALVWAVGSPFGLERSITFGILSAKHRAGRAGTHFQDLMQTDAAVNPGNSGGPLVDVTGRVVGINTAIVGSSYSGISFAIPSQIASDVVRRLKTQGRVVRGWLGLELDNLSESRAREMGLASTRGAVVGRIVSQRWGESPAGKAGIEPGDLIVEFDGTEVVNRESLIAQVGRTEVGKSVAVSVLRGGTPMQFAVTLGERPSLAQ